MKFLLSIILTSSIAVGLALIFSQGGYITFWWSKWRVDVAISTFLIFLFIIFILFWLVSKIFFELFSLPEKARKYREKVKYSRKVESIFSLVFSYFQGNYTKVITDAEKIYKNFKLRKIKDNNSSTLVDYLTAVAADKVGNIELRNAYIKNMDFEQRQKSNPYIFVDLLKIEALLKSKKTTEAVSFVSEVQKKYANSSEFLKLQVRVNEEIGDWEEVLRLSRVTEKNINDSSFNSNYYKHLSIENLLELAEKNPVSIKKVIGLIKNDYKKDVKLTFMLSSSYFSVGNENKARGVLEEFLDKSWNKSLLDLYSNYSSDPKASLKKFAQWEKRFNSRYEFQYNYGKVCENQKLWGKAQQHFEKSVELNPSVEAYVGLAKINSVMNNEIAASVNWKKAACYALKKINSSKKPQLEE